MEVEIKFSPPLREGVLLRRYKRFLADVRCADGETLTALCANTGSMRSCSEAGRRVMLSFHPEGTRKYPYTWEMIEMDGGWVGVNTGIPNNLAALALRYGKVAELSGYPQIRREVRYGQNSRVDFLLEGPPGRCYVEVKNVSLREGDVLCFPDAVTTRGTKHLEELMAVRKNGDRAAMLFVVQRGDGDIFRAADHIDPVYGETLRRASEAGVEVLVYQARVSPEGVAWGEPLSKNIAKWNP